MLAVRHRGRTGPVRTRAAGLPAPDERRVAGISELPEAADPAAHGLDASRLRRAGDYLGRYVDAGKLPGWQLVIARGGAVVWHECRGLADVGAGVPVRADTVWQLRSMTKPVTSVAAMILYEEGAFGLDDPIDRWLPEFGAPRVYRYGSPQDMGTVPSPEPIRVRHLLTHTAGLSYGFHEVHPVDALYRAAEEEPGWAGADLAARCRRWAAMPLVYEPGTRWLYSVATDVLGRLVEVASGRRLDEFFAERILGPLKMTDTAFWADGDRGRRLAAVYALDPAGGGLARDDAARAQGASPPAFLSGGGGLTGSAGDYHRFTQFLLRGGELDGVRLLGPRTVALMFANHLPAGASYAELQPEPPAWQRAPGLGFGLGFGVVTDPPAAGSPASAGTGFWSGALNTEFFADPAEDLAAMLFTQVTPYGAVPLQRDLAQLVYPAVTGRGRAAV
jgi:CubicO group peptidase (beta-lactamase class C family)